MSLGNKYGTVTKTNTTARTGRHRARRGKRMVLSTPGDGELARVREMQKDLMVAQAPKSQRPDSRTSDHRKTR